MPSLQQVRHPGPDPLPHVRRGQPAVPQAQRRQQKSRCQGNGNDRSSRPMDGERGIIRSMTTINSQDDFLEALRNNPQWRDAVRAQILGEDLLQLPVKFDAFVEQQTAQNEKFDAFVEEHRTTHTNMDARFDRMEGDFGTIKGDFARTRTVQDAQGIASDMGLEFVRTLRSDGLREMAGNTLPRDVGRSFRSADLVIEATDGTGTRYIAMEISFTADRRDCDRAIRNAGLITRFTGKPAQAAVASVRNDREAAEAVESGDVYWHQLEDRTPSPE